jgi:hypothetical protein
MNDGGKGSTPRPLSIDKKEFDVNFQKIFGPPIKKEDEDARGKPIQKSR